MQLLDTETQDMRQTQHTTLHKSDNGNKKNKIYKYIATKNKKNIKMKKHSNERERERKRRTEITGNDV